MLATVNGAAVNVRVHVSFSTIVSTEYMHGSGIQKTFLKDNYI